MAKWWQWVLNPIGSAVQTINGAPEREWYQDAIPILGDAAKGIIKTGEDIGKGFENAYDYLTEGEAADTISKVWDDLTGKSSIKLQNELNNDLAEKEYQRNLQAIGDTAAAYERAGLNRNLMYSSGHNAVNYSAPQLQAYSGSNKIDSIMSRVGKILSFIPAMYQATAALESIDQARERTKQSEIKTMSMGMNLLDQGYKLGDISLARPWQPTLYPFRFGTKRHVKQLDSTSIGISNEGYEPDVFSDYADAILKNRFDLLKSIGIKNSLNETLRDWRGYQYGLDRRFGAAGRIVGMASQGIGSVGRAFRDFKTLPKPKSLR